jgi:hypothetical protein
LGLFAFRQVRRFNDLADIEPICQRDDFGPDMTTGPPIDRIKRQRRALFPGTCNESIGEVISSSSSSHGSGDLGFMVLAGVGDSAAGFEIGQGCGRIVDVTGVLSLLFKDPYCSLVQSYSWISETDPSCPKNRPLETKHFHVNEPTNRQSRRETRRTDRLTQNNRSEIQVHLSLKTSIDDSDTQRTLLAHRSPAPMTESALGIVKAESFQVPALIADIGPEATKRYFEFFPFPSATRTRGSLTIMPSASSWIGASAPASAAWRILSRSR